MVRTQPNSTISDKIYTDIRNQVLSGVYAPGSSLPSTRALSVELGVSRSTVTIAFEQLAAEGYLEVSQGSRARVPTTIRKARPELRRGVRQSSVQLSTFGKRLHAFTPFDRLTGLSVDFRTGDISGEDFPELSWRKAVNQALSQRNKALKYDDALGSFALRQALRAYLWRSRGVRCEEQQIVIVNGSQQGIDLCARLFLDEGDNAVVEDPGYMLARHAFEAVGASTVPIPADEYGLQTSQLAGVEARLAYVTPSHQFPLGGILPVTRRQELIAWSRACGAYIIEDDYDSEFRYDTKPTETLHSLDPDGRVLYLGTVSKTLSPHLRLGYLVVPLQLAASFSLAKRLTDRHSATLQQESFQMALESGAVERHIRKARRHNGRRRAVLVSELKKQLGDRVIVQGESAGLHVVLWLNNVSANHEQAVIAAAGRLRLGLYGIQPLYASVSRAASARGAGFVMGYAALDEAEIKHGVSLLAKVLASLRKTAK